MDKHLHNSGVEKPLLSMTGKLGDLITLKKNQYGKNNLN